MAMNAVPRGDMSDFYAPHVTTSKRGASSGSQAHACVASMNVSAP